MHDVSEAVHYLTIGPRPLRLCLGCAEWFDEDVYHDFAACHEAFIREYVCLGCGGRFVFDDPHDYGVCCDQALARKGATAP